MICCEAFGTPVHVPTSDADFVPVIIVGFEKIVKVAWSCSVAAVGGTGGTSVTVPCSTNDPGYGPAAMPVVWNVATTLFVAAQLICTLVSAAVAVSVSPVSDCAATVVIEAKTISGAHAKIAFILNTFEFARFRGLRRPRVPNATRLPFVAIL